MSDSKKKAPKKDASSGKGDAAPKSSADFDKTVQDAERDTKTRKPGASDGSQSSQHNNGRGGGK